MKNFHVNRREFLQKTLGCSLCLTSTAFLTEVLAAGKDKTREQILNELNQKVEELMPIYGDCARTSFAVLNDQFKLKGKKLIRGLKPFPGIANRGETCGAVSGSMLALGLYFESPKKSDPSQPTETMKNANAFCDSFEKEFGSTMCRGVQEHQYGRAYDLRDGRERVEFMQAAAGGKCREVVKKAVRFAGEIILDNV
jgi:C_GCAxxG_C_C family probable redox protein